MEKVRRIKCICTVLFLLCCQNNLFARDNRTNSLAHLIRTTRDPLVWVNASVSLAGELMSTDPDSAFLVCKRTLEPARIINHKSAAGECYGIMSYVTKQQGRITEAIHWLEKGIEVLKTDTSVSNLASAYGNLGAIYYELGNYADAEHYYLESEALRRKINDEEGLSNSYYNLGNIYLKLQDHTKALDYYNRSQQLLEKIGFTPGVAYVKLAKGSVYFASGEYQQAIENQTDAIQLFALFGDQRGIAQAHYGIGKSYFALDKNAPALEAAEQALAFAQEIGNPSIIRDASLLLRDIYAKRGDHEQAIVMLEQYYRMRDSINNLESQQAAIRSNYEIAYQKEAYADSLAFVRKTEIETLKHDAELAAEKNSRYISYGGIAFLAVVIFLVVRGYRQKKKDNAVIRHQKELVEEKHKEITDSINYAERIQRSFLATRTMLDENLNDYFVLFLPKDVVSGDFYWAAQLANGHFALATADSTGHGVPGAIMSILNITCLEKAVYEEKLTDPGQILDHARIHIIDRLKKDGSPEGGKDGMDASLVCFDFTDRKIHYAAANNPVWVVRGDSLVELNADKMPVGKHEKQDIPFRSQSFVLQKGDVIYTFTDGFPDQFGGDKGKKFKYKNFKELLVQNAGDPLAVQEQKLRTFFSAWKGELEQVDDVCVIAIRL